MNISNISKQAVVIATAIAMIWLVGSAMQRVGKEQSRLERFEREEAAAFAVAMTFPPAELATIRTAAIRNGIQPGTENWYILLAIRKAENGKPGLEFGIMNPKAYDLDSQAGWAAASILGARGRWDGKGDFVDAMGARYCPPEDHPLNKHWAGNVRVWVEKLGGEK
jgi:hypothetical protein